MLLTTLTLAMATVGQGLPDWFETFPAHKIVGNVYYVGSKDLATFLITTPEGHILINSGFERTVPLIQKSVESLGFKMTDVKILLASHAHSDHVAGHALLQKLTGAKVYVMRGDDQVIASGGKGQYMYAINRWAPCKVDRVLEDRDEVKLGGITLVARLTPGHTRGCTTWTWRAKDDGKKYDVVVVGSPNVNPGFRLVDNNDYPEIAADFAKTFEVLKSLPCDVFLGAHGGYYGMVERYGQHKKGNANAFVNPKRLPGVRRAKGAGFPFDLGRAAAGQSAYRESRNKTDKYPTNRPVVYESHASVSTDRIYGRGAAWCTCHAVPRHSARFGASRYRPRVCPDSKLPHPGRPLVRDARARRPTARRLDASSVLRLLAEPDLAGATSAATWDNPIPARKPAPNPNQAERSDRGHEQR